MTSKTWTIGVKLGERTLQLAIRGLRFQPQASSRGFAGGLLCIALATAAVPVRAADGAVWLPFENVPVKMLSKKRRGPPLDDCAHASPHINSAAARMTAPVRLSADRLIRRIAFLSHSRKYPAFRRSGRRFH